MTYLLQVKTSYFCAAVEVEFPPEDGLIVDAAPILKWAIGKDLRVIRKYAWKNVPCTLTLICPDGRIIENWI